MGRAAGQLHDTGNHSRMSDDPLISLPAVAPARPMPERAAANAVSYNHSRHTIAMRVTGSSAGNSYRLVAAPFTLDQFALHDQELSFVVPARPASRLSACTRFPTCAKASPATLSALKGIFG